MWVAQAEYADGTFYEIRVPYTENDDYSAENQKQFELEEFLVTRKADCTWYSVFYEQD